MSLEIDDDNYMEDRVVKNVVCPPRYSFPKEKLFDPKTGTTDLSALRAHFIREGRLDIKDAFELIAKAQALFKTEPNCMFLTDPITVVGDIHGQFFDLIHLFEVGGNPEKTQYLFLGDYVDRGCFSCEVIFYLFAHKITYPKTFYMLRGNHESRQLTNFFNFKDECNYKYNLEIYEAIMACTDTLPLACVINEKFLCVHGGLSPELHTIKDIQNLDRIKEIPRQGAVCDIVWSDPIEAGDIRPVAPKDDDESDDDEPQQQQQLTLTFATNRVRRCSWVYGVKAVETFLEKNNLTSLIRAHEVQADGFKMHMYHVETKIPRVITIFSAPNYCDHDKNKAAILEFDNNLLNIRQFVSSEHPYYLPNFMNVFDWSLPFVAEKVVVFLSELLNDSAMQGDITLENELMKPISTVLSRRGNVIRIKLLVLGKILSWLKLLQSQEKNINIIKSKTSDSMLPLGILKGGINAINSTLSTIK